ncbi:lisH domain-containing protein C1711.05 [Hevea brasiliensis]|nr:lisH domain-containing protein C1711.05 [Hevea brasiliensis]
MSWKGGREKKSADSYDGTNMLEGNDQWDSDDVGDDLESDTDDSNEGHSFRNRTRDVCRKQDGVGRVYHFKCFRRNAGTRFEEVVEKDSESENILSDLDNAIHESDSEEELELRASRAEASHSFQSKVHKSEDMLSDLDNAMWESNSEQEEHDLRASSTDAIHNFQSSSDEEKDIYPTMRNEIQVNDTTENDEVLIELEVYQSGGWKLARISSFMTNAKDHSARKTTQDCDSEVVV